MHLWPSVRIRESFKISYLNKLEWNLYRMNSEKQRSQNQQRLLDQKGTQQNTDNPSTSWKTASLNNRGLIFKEILMLLSCCFCCGACVDEAEE